MTDQPQNPAISLETMLAALPPGRRAAVEAFLNESVATCPYCEQTVTRTTPRGLDADGKIGCLACVTTVVARCAQCGKDITRQHAREELRPGELIHTKCRPESEKRR